MLNTPQALEAAVSAAREVGEWLKQYHGNISYDFKEHTDVPAAAIVSAVDAEAEKRIRAFLTKHDPSLGFRGEETNSIEVTGPHWLVDPIDGTSHFIRGLPFCTTMISLVSEGEVHVAVIHDITRNETYWATKGGGAYKNGELIHVSERRLSNALISFETRFGLPTNENLYIRMQRLTKGLFSSINAGYEYALVASGRLDARLCFDPYGQDWDYAGGALLVKEAGGTVLNLTSPDSYRYKDHDFIAANPIVAKELREAAPELFAI